MQHCKAFFKIARWNIRSIIVYFIVFLVLLLLMANSGKETTAETFQNKQLDICVIDEDDTEASRALTGYLGKQHNLISAENDPEALSDRLYYRYIKYVLTIPKGYEENLLAGKTENLLTNAKVSLSAAGYFVDEQINEYLSALTLYLSAGNSFADASRKVTDCIEGMAEPEQINFSSSGAKTDSHVYYIFRYLPYVYIAILLCGMAPILCTFRKKDLHNRIGCSASSLRSRNLQLTISSILYSILVWLVFWLVGIVSCGKEMFSQNALLGGGNSFAFLIFVAGMTFLISSCVSDNNVLNLLANIIGLSMSFLCGVFVPMSMLSGSVQAVARFLPAYWYTRCNDMLGGMSKDSFSMELYWQAIGIQLLSALTMFVLAMVVSRVRKQRS